MPSAGSQSHSGGDGPSASAFSRAPLFCGLGVGLVALLSAILVLLVGRRPALSLAGAVALAGLAGAATTMALRAIGAAQRESAERDRVSREEYRELAAVHGQVQSNLEEAGRVQRGLMPGRSQQPFPRDVLLAHAFVPVLTVGGDYYDFKRTGPGTLAMLFVDVSGHGVGSALLTAIVKTVFEVLDESNLSPARFVSEVNQILVRITPPDSFVALVFAVYGVESRLLTYVNAGHQPLPMIVRRDGRKVEALGDGGLVAGFDINCVYLEDRVRLSPGDRFVLCTDGITESANEDGEMLGRERLVTLLADTLDAPAEDIPDRILEAVGQHSGTAPQSDDRTILVMEVLS